MKHAPRPSRLAGIFTTWLAALGGAMSLGLAPLAAAEASPDGLWRTAPATAAPVARGTFKSLAPGRGFVVQLAGDELRSQLAKAPLEGAAGRPFMVHDAPLQICLPAPDGTYEWFQIEESPIMEAGLAAKLPEIKTYRAQGLSEPAATARLDLTPQGFHAQVRSPKRGTWLVDPLEKSASGLHLSHAKADHIRSARERFICHNLPAELRGLLSKPLPPARIVEPGTNALSGPTLRTYRLAVGATGEYTAAVGGGTVSGAMAAIVTAINRVSGIFEQEAAIRFTLVANNSLVVFTNPATDGYSDSDPDAIINQNQAKLDAIIGNANYDIGHVFSTGGGGLAAYGVCQAGQKGRAVTGSSNPVGDAFYVDFVAHEVGHQFGADHTWNGGSGSCAASNWVSFAAYEPGSGSTIMAYSGLCPDSDFQSNVDPYFHAYSLQQIRDTILVGSGGCANTTATGNTGPVANAGATYTIPSRTPFTLTGSGTDANGDALTYCWEEIDLGPRQPNINTATDNGQSPLFRSYPPTTSPRRTFPRLETILSGTPDVAERLPVLSRLMSFRLTVRDNRSGGGGVDSADTALNVIGAAGPFIATAPAGGASWPAGSTRNVTWNVAGTTGNGINASHVDIRLSTDGGQTFPHLLASLVPNNGSYSLTVPPIATTQGRIKVEPTSNVFFAITPGDFTITLAKPTVVIETPAQNSASQTITSISGTASDPNGLPFSPNLVTFSYYDDDRDEFWTGSAWTSTPTLLSAPISGGTWTYSSLPIGGNVRDGRYLVTASVRNSAGLISEDVDGVSKVECRIDNVPPVLTITVPANNSTITSLGTALFGESVDASGLAAVNFYLRRLGDNTYWNGSTWVPASPNPPALVGNTTGINFNRFGGLPSAGSDPATNLINDAYELYAVGLDRAGNQAQTMNAFLVEFTYLWTGGTLRDSDPFNNSNDWSATGNWSPPGVPGANDFVEIANGDTVLSSVARTVRGMRFSSGTLSANVTVTGPAGRSRWSGGTVTATLNVPFGAGLEIVTTGSPSLNSGSLVNAGTVTVTGDPGSRFYGNGSTIDNTGTFEFARSDTIFANTGTTPNFLNHDGGVLLKSTSSGLTDFGNFHFTNTNASIEAATGVLRFSTAVTTLASPTAINGEGIVRFQTPSVQASGLQVVTGNVEIVTGCSVTLNAVTFAVAPTARLRFLGGVLTGSALLLSTSKLEIDTTADPSLNSLALTNHGTIALGGDPVTGRLYGSNTTITNGTGARFEFNRTGTIFTNTGTTPVFVNQGTLACTATSGVTDFGNFTLDGRSSGTYTIAGGTFRLTSVVGLAGGSTFSGAGKLQLASTSVTLNGAFNVNCDAEFPTGCSIQLNAVALNIAVGRDLRQLGGVLTGSATLPAGRSFEIETSLDPSWNALNFTNQGTLIVAGHPSSGTLNGSGTTLTNELGATLEFARNGTIFTNTGTTPNVVNFGTIRKSVGTGLTTFGNWNLTSQANANYSVAAGVLLFTNNLSLLPGTTLGGAGIVRLQSGNVSLTGLLTASCPLEIPGGVLTFNTATLATSGAGRLLLTGGTCTGNVTLPAGSRLEIDTTSDVSWSAFTLTNHGIVTIAGDPATGRLYGTTATLHNESDGRVEMARAGTIFQNTGSTPVFNQRGTLAKTTGGQTAFGNWRLLGEANAIYSLNGGELLLQGEVSFGAGSQLSGSGLVRLETGSLTVNGRLDLAVPTQFNAGSLVAANSAEIATLTGGSFTWTAGTLSGNVGIPVGTTWTIDTTAGPYLPGTVVSNHGTLILTGSASTGALAGSSAVLTNHADGRIEIARDGQAFQNVGTTPQLFNNGVIAKTAGTGLTDFGNFALTHATGANLQAVTGTLRLTTAASFAHDSQFTGSGSILLAGGEMTLSGRLLVEANTELRGGGLNAGSSGQPRLATGTGKQFLWTGGYIIGTLTVPIGSRLDLDTTNGLALGGELINQGRIVIGGSAASGVLSASSSTLLNGATATLEFARDGQIFQNTGNPPLVTNAGSIMKTAGSGVTDFGTFVLNNQGTLSVPVGQTLRFTSTIDLGPSSLVSGGGRVLLETSSATLSGATMLAASSTLELSGSLVGSSSGGQPLGSIGGAGTFRWSAGTVTGYVPLLAGSNAVFDTTNGGLGLYGTITLAGNATLSGLQSVVGSGSLFSILPGGLLHIPSALNVVNTGTPPLLQNGGTLRLSPEATLSTSWNYAQTSAGVLELQLNGSGAGQFSRINISGTASVNGQLKVTRLNGYSPALGTQFPVMTFSSGSGLFTSTAGLGLHNGLKLTPLVTATSVTLDTVVSAFGNWQADKFGANAGNPAIAGPYATPAGDGIPNVLKYAFGLNPLVDGSSKLPRASVQRDASTNLPHLGLTFRRLIGAADPLYLPRVSSGLTGAWDESGTQVEQLGAPSANGDGTETVTFRLKAPVAPGQHRFMDLLVDFE